jgi:dTDP-glucose 4,6-dehydratase
VLSNTNRHGGNSLKLLVTGGAGFIGSNFLRRIGDGTLSGISEVVILDKLTYAGTIENLDSVISDSRFEFVHGDILDAVLVGSLLQKVDSIVNFAAESHVDRSISSASDFVQTNIVGVQVLLDAIKNSG